MLIVITLKESISMKARSVTSPSVVEFLGNRYRLNYNIEQVLDSENNEVFEWDFIEVHDFKKGVVVAELIRQRYSLDDEIALINNYNLNSALYEQEYQEYQDYRNECKSIAINYINE